MAYDLLIKNGRIVDGSGMPAFRGDVARQGRQDRRNRQAQRRGDTHRRRRRPRGRRPASSTTTATTTRRSPGTRCAPSRREHGATTVIFGNCSLSLAPVRSGNEERMAEFLSYVEAIPMEVLRTVDVDWETFPQYMDRLDKHLGVNVGTLIGHTAVRYYVMGDDCQKRAATDDEIKAMQEVVRDGMKAGALGLSVSRAEGAFRSAGRADPGVVGRREGNLRARRRAARAGHRHDPGGRRRRSGTRRRHDGAARGGLRPPGRSTTA